MLYKSSHERTNLGKLRMLTDVSKPYGNSLSNGVLRDTSFAMKIALSGAT